MFPPPALSVLLERRFKSVPNNQGMELEAELFNRYDHKSIYSLHFGTFSVDKRRNSEKKLLSGSKT